MNQLHIDGEFTGYTRQGASKTDYGRLARTFLIAMFVGIIVAGVYFAITPIPTGSSARSAVAARVVGPQPAGRSKPAHPAPANTRKPPSGNSLASPNTTSDPSTTREP